MNTIRVLLIEDNALLRNGIEALLNRQFDINVIETAADFEKAASSFAAGRECVVLLDASLHDQNSLQVTEKLSRAASKTAIIVMDILPQKKEIEEFVNAGAVGCVNKEVTIGGLLATIRAVADGARVLPSQLPGSLFSQIVEHAARKGAVQLDEPALKLTGRERKIIALVGEGLSNEDISRKLKISPGAVQWYADSIMHKLAVRKILLPGNGGQ